MTPPRPWGTLLPLNSDSIYYCHRKLKLKGDFPSCQMRRLEGKCPEWPGMGTSSRGLLACTGLLRCTSSPLRGGLPCRPHTSFSVVSFQSAHSTCVYLCAGAMRDVPTGCELCFILEVQYPAQRQAHRVPKKYT